jgi:TolA-binding protein
MQLVGLLLSAFGVAAMIVAAVYVGRSKAKDETIDAQQSTISALSTRIESLHDSQVEESRRCEEKIASLQGQVDALSEKYAEAIAGLMAPKVVAGLVRALDSGDWGPR